MDTYQDLDRHQLTAVLVSSIETELTQLTTDLERTQSAELRRQIVDIMAKLDATRAHLLHPLPRPNPNPTVREFIYSLIETLEVANAGPSIS